jgi:hypothetical protein
MSARGFLLSRPKGRSSGAEVAAALVAAVLVPPIGLAVALFWTARGGPGSGPAPLIAVVSLAAAIALLAALGGGS